MFVCLLTYNRSEFSRLNFVCCHVALYAVRRALTKVKNCLVHGMIEFVDDADVSYPGDD